MEAREVLKELVAFKTESTPANDHTECAEYIAESLKKIGFETEIIDGSDGEKPKPNVLAQKNIGAGDIVLYAAHYDVVPPGDGWDSDPWILTERDGKLYGRGSSDDKGAIAAFISAMDEFNPGIGVKALFTCDEEIGGADGLGYVAKNRKGWLAQSAMAWIADSSNELIGIGSSGVLGGKIVVHGKGGHAGYPFRADNAVHRLFDLMTELRKYTAIHEQKKSTAASPPGSPFPNIWGRFSITMLSAGVKTNVIPDTAEACFDLRFLPEAKRADAENEFRRFFLECLAKTDVKADMNFLYGHEGYLQPITPRIENFKERISAHFGDLEFAAELGGNDGPFLFNLGIPTVAFGDIDRDAHFHIPNEFMRLEILDKMTAAIREFYSKGILQTTA